MAIGPEDQIDKMLVKKYQKANTAILYKFPIIFTPKL